jgi:hypothetical protein
MVKNRKQIEKLIYDTLDAIDPSGNNTMKYRSLYEPMTDTEFEKHMKEFLSDDNENFILDIVEFEHDLNLEKCEAAAKVIGIPLAEYVFMPHLTMDKKRVVVSKEKCLVGWMNVKRPQQLLHKKNGLAMANDKISAITGQVTGEDKDARDSDIEAAMLVSLGCDKILQELHGPRADDEVMRRQMTQDITTKGYVLLDELENNPVNKVSLRTLDVYLTSMGIKSDVISDTYILPPTIEDMV